MNAAAKGLLERLPATVPAREPAFLRSARERALGELKRVGLPGKKTEGWRFTPIANVTALPFATRSSALSARSEGPVEILPLETALARGAVEQYLGKIAPERAFAALNTSLFQEGLVAHVKAGAPSTLTIEHRLPKSSSTFADYPRILVVIEPGAELVLVETYEAEASESPLLCNPVTEIAVGERSRVEHIRILRGARRAHHVGSLAVRQERDSVFASRVMTFGGTLSRLDLDVKLAGSGAQCVLDGVYLAGDGEHVDHQTRVDHEVPHAQSRQRYRGIMSGAGHGVFDGTVFVRKDAQHTSAHQENRNLLLSDGATVHTKPHLEIEADDVTCSHGATVGALDPDQLFYLRARGVGALTAAAMLTLGFVRELVADVSRADLRSEILEQVRRRCADGGEVELAEEEVLS